MWKHHGLSGTAEHRAWRAIKNRCLNAKTPAYKNYGAKGVKIHPDWANDFLSFFQEIGKRPSLKHSVDRIDNNRGYEPGNVRWATHTEQMRNTGSTRFFEYDGMRLCRTEWANVLNVSVCFIENREGKMPFSKIVAEAYQFTKRREMKGVTKRGNSWIARRQRNGKTVNLGTFDSPDKARTAYLEDLEYFPLSKQVASWKLQSREEGK